MEEEFVKFFSELCQFSLELSISSTAIIMTNFKFCAIYGLLTAVNEEPHKLAFLTTTQIDIVKSALINLQGKELEDLNDVEIVNLLGHSNLSFMASSFKNNDIPSGMDLSLVENLEDLCVLFENVKGLPRLLKLISKWKNYGVDKNLYEKPAPIKVKSEPKSTVAVINPCPEEAAAASASNSSSTEETAGNAVMVNRNLTNTITSHASNSSSAAVAAPSTTETTASESEGRLMTVGDIYDEFEPHEVEDEDAWHRGSQSAHYIEDEGEATPRPANRPQNREAQQTPAHEAVENSDHTSDRKRQLRSQNEKSAKVKLESALTGRKESVPPLSAREAAPIMALPVSEEDLVGTLDHLNDCDDCDRPRRVTAYVATVQGKKAISMLKMEDLDWVRPFLISFYCKGISHMLIFILRKCWRQSCVFAP